MKCMPLSFQGTVQVFHIDYSHSSGLWVGQWCVLREAAMEREADREPSLVGSNEDGPWREAVPAGSFPLMKNRHYLSAPEI